jgi:hypothetical protein
VDDDEEWTWRDVVALIVAAVWAMNYLAALVVKGYEPPIESHVVMLAVLGGLGFTTPKN